ncbi:FAD/NAD(P)-binding protein [Nonomuraea sp. LP-02]|uniref:FAD/NAD(P)-binding protein n=1 Tax=Nonomuraea sp. LP-02 TaxID=3097960 RepID=UPI002E31A0D5|nr:FAD/NAD(P)-binding protein [Nonomuraea sp. LP-02]MED7924281.1 FAD/NAD(P)-binding protein [Nonomuraea sp. LP-02]
MRIAIIGAGAAAVGLLDALAVSETGIGEVTVFEPAAHPWRGRPYGPDLDGVLVNAPPAIMSIRHLDFGHYASWLGRERAAAHLDDLLGQPLVPRALYGAYLADTAEAALARLRERGWRTRLVAARVVAAARSGDGLGLTLRTEDGRDHPADRVALCVGGGSPQDHYGLGGAPGFVRDPYPLAYTLAQVPAAAAVTVIGSGLTAVDVVVSLAARGHAGPITLASRSGLLPHVWQRPLGHRPVHVTVERVEALCREHGGITLDDLAGLLRAELAEAGEDFAHFTAELLAAGSEEPVRRLRRQLAAVGDPRIGRRVLQETAHTVGPYAWRLLPEPDRERLRGHFRLATSVASPMVPVNAAALLRLFESGQLSVMAGVRKIEAAEGGFRVRGDGGDLNADVVVNAVNPPPKAVPRAAEPLVTSLLSGGLAALHPSGGLIPADPRLHVVGDLAGGGPFITSGIPGVAAAGARAVSGLLATRTG